MAKNKTQDDVVVLRTKFAEVNNVVSAVERWIDRIWGMVFTWYSTYEPGTAVQFLRTFKLEMAEALRQRYTSSLVDEDIGVCKEELGESHEISTNEQSEQLAQALRGIEQVQDDDARLAKAILDLGVATIEVMRLGIAPARKLREKLIAELRFGAVCTEATRKAWTPA